MISLVVVVALFGVPQGGPIDRSDVDRLIDGFLAGGGRERAGAIQALAHQPLPSRTAIDARIAATRDEKVKDQLLALRRAVLERGLFGILEQRIRTNLTFSGQWADLAQYDPTIGQLLLSIAQQLGVPSIMRQGALNAIGDLKAKELIPELKRITEDILCEDGVIEAAGLALGELGDRSWVDAKIAFLERIAAAPTTDVPRRYTALKDLARYHYRFEEYRKAIDCYRETVQILEGRLKTIDEKGAARLREILRLTYYNTACSASKGGLIDDAFSCLEKALAADPTRAAGEELEGSIQQDGDLKAVRSDPRFPALLEKVRSVGRGKSLSL